MTRVLVVEDDPQLVRALVINLHARHYGVDAAPDGATALRLAAARQPDVVLLDLGLPDMDGVDIIKGVRGWSRVPILVLSARQASDEKVAALDAGCRRLHHQAVQHGQAARPAARRRPPDRGHTAGPRDDPGRDGALHPRPARQEGRTGRAGRTADPDRVASAGDPGDESRPH